LKRIVPNSMKDYTTCVVVALVSLALTGCPRETSVSSVKQAQQSKIRDVVRADSLLKAAAIQLNDLPSAVDTELRPPTVILDSRKSADKQDVYAICTSNPAVPNSPINIIYVPTGNGRFRSLGVRPGDVLKYFVRDDRTVDDDSRNAGLSRQLAVELRVAQVIDDNTLMIDSSLNQIIPFPAKLEIWRHVDDRLHDINEKLNTYIVNRKPALGWEPAPDEQSLPQVLAWLNQWIRQSETPAGWKPDPLLETLPAELAGDKELADFISLEALTAKSFTAADKDDQAKVPKKYSDGRLLQEAVWLRDIARWAHGSNFDDLSRATALFDWTVRNIQLEPDGDGRAHRPWHILLYGRGTAAQRAWVFALLCRQQGLNVVMLGIPDPDSADEKAATAGGMYWLPALFSKGQLYLFDARLGLPIAGPNGKGVATLEQALKDDALIRQFDLDCAPYAVTSDSLKNAKAYIVADPFEISRRAAQVEAALSGDERVSLAVKPSELGEQLKGVHGISGVALWDLPYRTLRDQLSLGKSARHREALAFEPFAVRPSLWKARTRHFQGRRKAAEEPDGVPLDDHQEAVRLYMSKSVRPTDAQIAGSDSVDKQRVDSTAKTYATYWLGLLSFDDGKYDVAANWFSRPDLVAKDSLWLFGSRYNLGRSLEAQEKYEEAIPILEQDTSPQQQGNRHRARELKSRPPAPEKPKPSE
jgi:tetratricopeptide (TPR) repeat protein